MPLIIMTCFETWYAHRDTKKLKEEGRLLIIGRPAWEYWLKGAGVEFIKERDGKYWIYEFEKGRVQ
jgi:hypothetical protein